MFAEQDYLDDLFAFISRSPTACHAAASGAALLADHGFTRLFETDHWGELAAGSYYLLRDDASLIAWTLTGPAKAGRPLRLAGAHTDSPALKIKPNPVQLRHDCVQLGVEVYGGALLNPWFDRDLSIAGRVVWQQANGPLQASLIDFRRPVATIPSLAIHLDREANDKRAIDRQTALVPLLLQAAEPPDFHLLLAERLAEEHPDTDGAEVVDFDLFLYDTQPPARVGLHDEFISGPRLDNLLSCHALLVALTGTDDRRTRWWCSTTTRRWAACPPPGPRAPSCRTCSPASTRTRSCAGRCSPAPCSCPWTMPTPSTRTSPPATIPSTCPG